MDGTDVPAANAAADALEEAGLTPFLFQLNLRCSVHRITQLNS